jgi:phosphatidylethanolamine-binding protein (PEBP) family uncharacterized protein
VGHPAGPPGLPAGAHAPHEARNGAGGTGYLGPCPPSGRHHYTFRLFALDGPLRLARTADRVTFERALRGHVRAAAMLVGTYKRR